MLDSLGHPDGLDPSLSCYWTVASPLLPFLELGWVSFQNCLQGRPYSIVGCSPFTLLLLQTQNPAWDGSSHPCDTHPGLGRVPYSLSCILDCYQVAVAVLSLEQVPDSGDY